MNVISTLIKITREHAQSALLLHVKMQQEVDSLQPRRELSSEPDHAGIFISDIQPLEL